MTVKNQKNYKEIFKADLKPNWCPRCGDYGLLSASVKALSKLDYRPNEVVLVSGIGCSSSFPHWTKAYGIHMLHGRALPAAAGVKMVNPELTVIAVGGDGDGYGIGVGHFVHTARRNLAITYMVMNNQIYGLTMGQASPSSQLGHVTITAPQGVDEQPINPLALALGAGASFIARGFSGDSNHLQAIIEEALNHNGFAFIDVLSPCVTFNKVNTYEWFRERVYKLDKNHDQSDISAAFYKSLEWGDRIPLGIFYKSKRPPLHKLDSVTKVKNPVKEPLGFKAQGINIQEVFNDFR
ncbi:MAG: thiamine pyrophosphate-dependent enzyme [Candidatus Hodarchaeales archaeon]|jgi:2-oxoglutarate ferredoxin oxidoreductase subunit beta